MSTPVTEEQIQLLLYGLGSGEAKRRESTARTIAQYQVRDPRVSTALAGLAAHDPVKYVREAARLTLTTLGETSASAAAPLGPGAWERVTRELADQAEIAKLEFLLKETADWQDATARQQPYAARLAALKAMYPTAASTTPAPQFVAPAPTAPVVASELPRVRAAPPAPGAPPVPFDQWLLSERNIKLALYSGGVLLILAGLIFVGVNWAYLPGIAKFGITLAITALLYVGGALLFRRSLLKLGGVALLGIASGFLPLNFAVLQIYVLRDAGLSDLGMWLIASALCLTAYALTAYHTRHSLFTYLALGALLSAVYALFALFHQPSANIVFGYALSSILLLLAARAVRSSAYVNFTRAPLLVIANILAPVVFLYSFDLWILEQSWLDLGTLLVVVVFYLAADWLFNWLAARWVAAFSGAFTVVLALTQLKFSEIQTGLTLMLLALVYLGIGWVLARDGQSMKLGLPLYTAGYFLAAFVTLQAASGYVLHRENLALALVGDAALLAVSARVFRSYEWMYGATWLLIAPAFIYATIYLRTTTEYGLALGALLLVYVACGYVLGRRELRYGAPFLTAAAFLSVVIPAVIGADWRVNTMALAGIAVLYFLIALWRQWAWLQLPALAAGHLAILTVSLFYMRMDLGWLRVLTVAYTALGVLLVISAVVLRRFRLDLWAGVRYLVAAFDLGGAFLVSLVVGSEITLALAVLPNLRAGVQIALGVALSIAAVCFALAWIEREWFIKIKLPALLTYVGALFVFVAQVHALRLVPEIENWTSIFAALCALYVALAWVLNRTTLRDVFATSLRRVGLVLLLVPILVALLPAKPFFAATTYAISAVVLLAEARRQRHWTLAYVGGGSVWLLLWSLLQQYRVTELQAYVFPLGVGLLALGWNEGRRGRRAWYQLATLFGLLILMGTAFSQSFGDIQYAVLLLVESLLAFGWGVRTHSRSYVEVSVLALLANALVQYGPAFANLERWIQIGAIGTLLLGGGLGALFRREQILAARRSFASGWKTWNP